CASPLLKNNSNSCSHSFPPVLRTFARQGEAPGNGASNFSFKTSDHARWVWKTLEGPAMFSSFSAILTPSCCHYFELRRMGISSTLLAFSTTEIFEKKNYRIFTSTLLRFL